MNLAELTRIMKMMQHLNNSRPRGTRTGAGRTKPPYVPGTIGVSAVTVAIVQDHGRPVDRRTRRLIAKRTGKPFKAYYNGPVYQ